MGCVWDADCTTHSKLMWSWEARMFAVLPLCDMDQGCLLYYLYMTSLHGSRPPDTNPAAQKDLIQELMVSKVVIHHNSPLLT